MFTDSVDGLQRPGGMAPLVRIDRNGSNGSLGRVTTLAEHLEALPTDNEGWFKRHIIDTLARLEKGQTDSRQAALAAHESNSKRMDEIQKSLVDHAASDTKNFSQLEQGVESLQPTRRIVQGAVVLILVAFLTAIISLVVIATRPASVVIQPAAPAAVAPIHP